MAGVLISGPAGSGKSQHARQVLAERPGPAVVLDFQAIYAALLLLDRDPDGRYPERDPADAHLLPTAEYLRRAGITAARNRDLEIVATNSDGDPARRAELLGLIGGGATETVLDPGIDVVRSRLAVDGRVSAQCEEAIQRWYGRL